MSLKVARRIRDNVHGSIDITELEDAIIAHPFFQRLRRVKQLAFLQYVFPGASHSRFEHSLGVLHLSGVVWEKLRANQTRLQDSLKGWTEFAESEPQGETSQGRLAPTFALMGSVFEADYVLQCLRLAALLHDVGHPPFSHSGERFMPSWAEVLKANPGLPYYLADYLKRSIESIKGSGLDPNSVKVRHEVYSILLIERLMRDTYDRLGIAPAIAIRDVISIINPAIKPDSQSALLASGAYPLLRELISGELDIDRMDYLLRDSRECGVVYGVFDADRIFDSLSLYFDDSDQQLHVAINLSGLAAFEDYLRARYSMYLQLYFHKSSVAAEAMIQSLSDMLGDWILPAKVENYAAIDEYNIGQALFEAAERLENKETRDSCIVLIADLLYNRRLWKRVYETSGTQRTTELERGQKICALLKQNGYRCQLISSGNSLTRFQPKGHAIRSKNYLRLIRKDDRQLPRVCAIEDYSKLIAGNDSITIHRVYVELNDDKNLPSIRVLIRDYLAIESKTSILV